MAEIATGLWWDYSKSRAYAWTLTLPVNQGNTLLSGLTLLITLAGASFWNITAFALHRWKSAQGGTPTALDLQQQVILRNSRTSIAAMWELIKLCYAWSGKPGQPRRRWMQTCALVVPAMIVWACFVAAAIFTARLANGTAGVVLAPIRKGNCGLWEYNASDVLSLAAYNTKSSKDTAQARTYVSTFYTNRTVPIQATYTNNDNSCMSNSGNLSMPARGDRAFGMSTGLLDSHEMFGINAPRKDRVTLQLSVTCSPVSVRDLVELVDVNNATFLIYFLGNLSVADNMGLYSLEVPQNWTYLYNTMTIRTSVSYLLASRGFYAPAKNNSMPTSWHPVADFFRRDADLSLHILSQNSMAYFSPVLDPFFYANGSNTRGDFATPNYLTTNMICADQYVLCNPQRPGRCSSPSGWGLLLDTLDILPSDRDTNVLGELQFNQRQLATAHRLVNALVNTNTFQSVAPLGAAALWANSIAYQYQSSGLPPTQWQTEVLGWFQTTLAKLQTYVVDYAANPDLENLVGRVVLHGFEPGIETDPATHEWAVAWRSMCTNQLVRTAGEVQNFNFLGVVLVIAASVMLVLLSLILEQLIDLITRRRRGNSLAAKQARQADEQLHLLRMALKNSTAETDSGSGWELGRWGIPVLNGSDSAFNLDRPAPLEAKEELVAYQNLRRASNPAPQYDNKRPGVETVEEPPPGTLEHH
ncbi:hypothetical protein GQ44DRAFT_734045 [Phaeosphaeriaceae sp. PMI808]|nr:hypothetical protein GQ44DRAFT_734045 [Phaeosphaeriaceae sp. PMI808]